MSQEIMRAVSDVPAGPGRLDRIEKLVFLAGGKVNQKGHKLEELHGTVLSHHFTPGIYCRKIVMPAGQVVMSATHKTEHQYVVSGGACLVFNELTQEAERVEAPHRGITLPGTRRCLFIERTCTWLTFHPTDETDLSKLELLLMEEHLNPLLEGLVGSVFADQADYGVYLLEAHLADDQVKTLADCHPGAWGTAVPFDLSIRRSEIHGRGVFARTLLSPGERFALGYGPIRRFLNHAKLPNCEVRPVPDAGHWLVPVRRIEADEELTVDYRHAYEILFGVKP